jgi:broad specificity phosphatase PhoE
MTEILLVRHGETDWNAGEIFRGRADVELNETGLKQARLVAKYLEDVPLEAVYASPLKRTIKTAEAVCGYHNLDVASAPELMDLDFGEWQGLPSGTVKEKYGKLYDEWLKNPHLIRIPGGESLEDVRRRAIGLVDRVVAGHEGAVALISHRVVHKVIICALLGLDNSHFWNIRLDTCGITIFAHDNGRFILNRHNDTSFLKSLGGTVLKDF